MAIPSDNLKTNYLQMKLGFGLYRHMLTPENYRFARQCGATHLVVHLVDYFKQEKKLAQTDDQPTDTGDGWGIADTEEDFLWTEEGMLRLKQEMNAYGLEWYAIENLNPAHWHDILLDGPQKAEQIERVKDIIRTMGKVGIPCLGYNFSIAGVASRVKGPYARGGAISVGMDGVDENPLPEGMVWNMWIDKTKKRIQKPITSDQLWQRLQGFLEQIIPVAEEAGVILAAHPDDPPMPEIRKTPRLVYQPDLYHRLIALNPSPNNQLEFCLGSLAEMTEGDIYEKTDIFSKENRIGYIHFRNIKGKVPTYKEVFIDEGDIDMFRILKILKANRYEGVLIPDHTPQMSCDAPWHAGMAYAMGFMMAAMKRIDEQ